MGWKISNFCESTLSQACDDNDTTIYISATDADLLPTLGVGDKAKGVLFNASYKEIVNITAEAGGALTVERGQEGTSARAWAAGTKFVHAATAEILQATLASLTASKFTGTVSGTNAYSVNVGAGNPLPTLTDGEEVIFTIPNSNTDAATPTLVVTDGTTSTTLKNIERADGSVPDALELKAGFVVRLMYSTAADAWLITNITSRDALIERINLGPIPGINRARNGMYDYWNNGTNFSTPASLTETADGWLVSYDGTIGTFTVSRQSFTLGQTDVEGDPKYFWRWAHTSAGSGSTVRRVYNDVARVNWRNGETVTISFWAKADTNRNITLRTRQYFGSGGAPSASVDLTDVLALTASWQKFTVTKTLASVAGKTLGSSEDDALRIILDFPVNVTMTIDIAAFDVRQGEVSGQADDMFPLSFQRGGLGGSYDSLAEITTAILASQTDLLLVEALASSGLVYRNNTGPVWGTRSIAAGAGMGVTNGDGLAGNPTVAITNTALVNYMADPLSVAELASITGNFGTAAFKALGTSGDTVAQPNGANTWSALQTFSPGSQTTASFDRNSNTLSTAVGFDLSLRDSGSNLTTYARVLGSIEDNTDGGEDGQYLVQAVRGGAVTTFFRISGLNATVTFENNTSFTSAGVVLVPAGSAAAPAIAGSGDTNTGFEFPGGDVIYFNANGARRFQLDVNGLQFAGGGLGLVRAGGGTVSVPSLSFTTETDCGFYVIGTNNVGLALNGALAVDFSTGRVLLGVGQDLRLPDALVAPTGIYSVGFRGIPVINGNSAYAFPATDAGCCIYHDEAGTRTYTIPANASVAHPIGTTFVIDNTGNAGAAGAITLAITSDTLRRGDGTAGTGSRTIPASGVATIRKVAATVWVITGIFT